MNTYLSTAAYALGAGLVVGLCYGFAGLRSPAPPVVALIGLLGMLAGEQAAIHLRGPGASGADRGVQRDHGGKDVGSGGEPRQ